MAHKKAAGSAKNLRDSQPKYRGVKLFGGQKAVAGNIIIRQNGSKYECGKNTYLAADFTIHASIDGVVVFKKKNFRRFDGRTYLKTVVAVFPEVERGKLKVESPKLKAESLKPKAEPKVAKEPVVAKPVAKKPVVKKADSSLPPRSSSSAQNDKSKAEKVVAKKPVAKKASAEKPAVKKAPAKKPVAKKKEKSE